MHARKVLAVALAMPLLTVLFIYGAALQPVRFWWPGIAAQCADGQPVKAYVTLVDYMAVPFVHVKFYSPDGRLVAAGDTGPGGACPIKGLEPGSYVIVASGSRYMFVDFVDVPDSPHKAWGTHFLIMDPRYTTSINYGLLPGKVKVGGLELEVPPLTALYVPRGTEFHFEEGAFSLRWLLEPFSGVFWNPLMWRAALSRDLLLAALLTVAAYPFAFRWRRKYAAVLLALFLLEFLGPWTQVGEAQAIGIEIQEPRLLSVVLGYGCDPSLCKVVEFNTNLPPPYSLRIVMDVGVDVGLATYSARITYTFTKFILWTYVRDPSYHPPLAVFNTTVTIEIQLLGPRHPVHLDVDTSMGSMATSPDESPIRLDDIHQDQMPFRHTFINAHPVTFTSSFVESLFGRGTTVMGISTAITIPYLFTGMSVYFTLTFPTATDKTAVSLVTKYFMRTGFGKDNPINYSIPRLPPGVEQKITGLELLPETMFSRQYSIHLLPKWAEPIDEGGQAAISSALVTVLYTQPTALLGPIPGQEWVEPPTARAEAPNRVALYGKIKSGFLPFLNTRIPFAFAPYYEFPTVVPAPLRSDTPGPGIRGLENATFVMQMEFDIDNNVFLNPPWFKEGDIGSYAFYISLGTCFGLPVVWKFRKYFAGASKALDDLKSFLESRFNLRVPTEVEDELRTSINQGVREVMKEEVTTAKVQMENIPRIPTGSELAQMPERERALYNEIIQLVTNSRRVDFIQARMFEKFPELNDAEIIKRLARIVRTEADDLLSRYAEGTVEHWTGKFLNLWSTALKTQNDPLSALNTVLSIAYRHIESAPDDHARLIIAQGVYKFLTRANIDSYALWNDLRPENKRAFISYVEVITEQLRQRVNELTGIPIIRRRLAELGLAPKVTLGELASITFDAGVTAATLLSPVVAGAAPIACAVSQGIIAGGSWLHAIIDGEFRDNPTGVAMAGAIIFKLDTPSGTRLAYISVAEQIEFGIMGLPFVPRETAAGIVDKMISKLSEVKGYGPPVKLREIVARDPIDAVGELNTMTWNNIDRLIIEKLGTSEVKIIGIGILPVYIPYVNAGAFRAESYTFDFSTPNRKVINVGLGFSLVAVVSRQKIDDPYTMIQMLNPLSINGIEATAEHWSIIPTNIRDPKYPWPIPAMRPWLVYGFSAGRGEPPKSLFIEAKNPNPFSGTFRLNVTHEFLWDPTTSQGGFGVPCLAGEKLFRGLFQVLNVRFYRYPVFGPSPPDSVIFTLRAENATVEKVYGSDLMTFTKGSFVIPGSAFIWTKVDEDASAGITYWNGELKRNVQMPVFSLLVGCGYGFDVSLGERDATRGNIKGSVDLVSSTVATPRGYAELPTEALFKVEAYRPPSQPNAPRITAEMTVGYYAETDPKGGPKWIEFRQDVRDVTSFPASFRMPIGDLVMKAIDFASKTGKPVVVRASMRLYNEPPGYTVIQPSPKEWAAQPVPPVPLARTWDLTVLVLDEATDLPIAGALVIVENTTHAFHAITDASGVAAFRLTTGSYSVRATAEGYRPSAEVHINLVEDAEVVLRLARAPAEVATVTAYVYDGHTSAPIPGASVSLDSRTGTTGADGTVVFHDVPFGSYLLEVTHPDYAPYSRSVSIMNETVRIDVPLLTKRPVTTATVTVLDAVTGSPIQGATVQFENGTMVYTGTTGPDGIARITLPMGGYTLRVSASGYYPFAQTVFVPQTGFSTTVRLAPTTKEPGPPKPPTPPEECDIPLTTIEVVDATNGAGIPGAQVTLVRGGFTYRGTTDSNGEAKFCITSGIYSYRVEKAGYQTTEGTSFIVEGTTFTIAMTPLSAIPTGRLKVLVVDAANLAPIAGAEVSVRNSTHILTKYTDASGRTEFLLVAGGYTITARKSGYLDFSAELDFPGGDVNYTVSLTPHGMCEYPGNWTEPTPCGYRWLVVSVGYKDGFPFAGAQVTVSNGTMSKTRVTDGTGSVKFLLDPDNYTVTVSATFNSTTWTTSFEVNLNQNLWIVVLTPWYSPYFMPEVRVVYVSFVGPRMGIWGYDHLIAAGFWSNIPQTIAARIAAINYTRYARDGTIQILAEKIITLDFRDSAFNETLVTLNINGTGFALVAPMATILSYQNDTFTGNNELIGPPIPFGPLIDISVLLIVEVDSAPTGALVPEITRMNVTVVFWSTVDLDVPGRLMLKTRYHSILERRVIERPLLNESFVPRVVAQNKSVTFYLDWTNVTMVSVFVKHDLEINELDNNQTAYIYLDRAIKLVQVKVPPLVRSDSYFNVTVTVLSNVWPSFEYSYLAQLGGTSSTGFFRAGYGYTNATLTVRAPQVAGWAPRTMEMNVTVGPDFDPHDNSMKVLVTVVPEQAVPWILLLLGLLVVAVGGMAISRAVRRAQAVYRTRRALRSAGGGEAEWWPEAWWNVVEKPEEGHKRRRRALR